ncbi:PQQ-binding-like beta-propeller repeat protein [Rhizobium sp. BK008]|uniref:outer membrane protein assembly factor BamB family protein n=1 Tax=Rhizobium sp. BK008 TaxID=2587094 RepID=UPI00161C4E2E|nr:PQQ-binding-like beta-propeller repeat protein [Rhizobium sp. BK008]MBB4252718.1 WD40 repeat protein [Rhizobium sp. BK008]
MATDSFAYDVFVSYATDPDGQLVRAVEDLLENFHRRPDVPKDLITELKLCVDGRDFKFPRLSPGTEPTDAIEQVVRGYLRQCRSLIVFCGPMAHRHPWINREIEWWDKERPDGPIYFAFTHGQYPDPAKKTGYMPKSLIARGGPDNSSYFDLRRFYQGRHWLNFKHQYRLLAQTVAGPLTRKNRPRSETNSHRNSSKYSNLLNNASEWKSVRSFDDEVCRIAAQLVSDKLEKSLAVADLTNTYLAADYNARKRRVWRVATGAVVVFIAISTAWMYLDRMARERRASALADQAQAEIDNRQYEQAMRLALAGLPLERDAPWAPGWEHPTIQTLLAKLAGAATLSGYRAEITEGDNKTLTSAAFSRDGQRIVTSSEAGVTSLWDSRSMEKIASCSFDSVIAPKDRKQGLHKGSPGWIRDSQFSADGKRIVSVGPYRTAWIWSAQDDGCTHPILLLGHEDDVRTGAFSPNGELVVTTSDDDSVRIWDSASGAQRLQLKIPGTSLSPSDYTTSAEFSPDGSRLVITRSDGLIALADTSDFNVVALETGSFAWRARFSRDSKKLVTVLDNGNIAIWDVTGRFKIPLPKQFQPVVDASFSPNGRLVVTASADASVRILDLTTFTERFVFRGHQKSVTRAEFSPDGKEILTSSADGYARIWTAEGNVAPLTVKAHAKSIKHLEINPGGNSLFTVGSDRTAKLWELRDGDPRLLKEFGSDDHYVISAAFHPREQNLVLAYSDGRVSVVSQPDGKEIYSAEIGLTDNTSVSFDPSGTQVVIGDDSAKSAVVWNLRTGERKNLEGSRRIRSIAFKNETLVAMGFKSAEQGARVGIWDTSSTEMVQSYPHDGDVLSVHFNSDHTRLATASLDGVARIWGTSTEEPDLTLYHGKDVNSARFSRDGSRIVTASGDHTVRVWDALTGSQIIRFDIESTARDALVTPDGDRVVVASDEGFLEVFDVSWTADKTDLPRRVCREKLKGIESQPRMANQPANPLLGSDDINPCDRFR